MRLMSAPSQTEIIEALTKALKPFAEDYVGSECMFHRGRFNPSECPRCSNIIAARGAIAFAEYCANCNGTGWLPPECPCNRCRGTGDPCPVCKKHK